MKNDFKTLFLSRPAENARLWWMRCRCVHCRKGDPTPKACKRYQELDKVCGQVAVGRARTIFRSLV